MEEKMVFACWQEKGCDKMQEHETATISKDEKSFNLVKP